MVIIAEQRYCGGENNRRTKRKLISPFLFLRKVNICLQSTLRHISQKS